MTMFKIPDWGEEVPKTNIGANLLPKCNLKKTKEAKNSDLNKIGLINKGSPLEKQITNHIFKKIKKFKNKKLVTNTSLKFKNNRASFNKSKDINVVKNKVDIEKETVNKSELSSIIKTKKSKLDWKKKSNNKKLIEFISPKFCGNEIINDIKENNIITENEIKAEQKPVEYAKSSVIDIKNYDTDKLDEEILNAKKEKLVESYKNDDNEETLFTENEDLRKQIINKNKSQLKVKIEMTTSKEEYKRNLTEKTVDSKESLNNNNGNCKPRKRKYNKLKDTEIINNNKDIKVVNNSLNSETMVKLESKRQQNNNKKLKQSNKLVEKNSEGVQVDHSKNPLNIKDKFKKQSLKTMFERNHYSVKNSNELQEKVLEKLNAAKFRFLNEKLYTSNGSEAQKLFQDDPSAFQTYHQGYQQQVRKWTIKPLDVVVKRIKNMPKTHIIADMGCGEAALSQRVSQSVRSFDLVATAPGVEVCDIAHTPLLSESVHVAVYCLALMGTDLTQYLVEANRVLKIGGNLLIAEVESRFDNVDNFVKEVSRLGFTLRKLDKSHELFYFMEFTKERGAPVKKAKLPSLYLKPCIYKKR